MSDDNKRKHLDYLQAVIARMSSHSFVFKGWSITVVGALFSFAVVNSRTGLVAVALVSGLLFWGLDGYYLWIERGYVDLYGKVAAKSEAEIDFQMKYNKENALRKWLCTCFRPHLVAFYGAIAVMNIIGIFTVRSK